MYIHVKVHAGAKKETIEQLSPDHWEIAVKEKAERNMANRRVLEIMHEATKKTVRLVSGHHSPSKIINVE